MAEPTSCTSLYSIPYPTRGGSTTGLNTLDLHFPVHSPQEITSDNEDTYWMIFIHGGAFRDPTNTSRDILPALARIFVRGATNSTSSNSRSDNPGISSKIRGVASLNYRLSPYPNHPTDPSHTADRKEGRNAIWPTHLEDCIDGVKYVLEKGEVYRLQAMAGQGDSTSADEKLDSSGSTVPNLGNPQEYPVKYILAGHSVGATLAFKIAECFSSSSSSSSIPSSPFFSSPPPIPSLRPQKPPLILPPPTSLVLLSGIYDFPTCLASHPHSADIYNEMFTSAFGGTPESGAWDVGFCPTPTVAEEVPIDRLKGVEPIVCMHGEKDDLVEKGQVEGLVARLRGRERVNMDSEKGRGWEGGVKVLEWKGKGHDDMVQDGEVMRWGLEVVGEGLGWW